MKNAQKSYVWNIRRSIIFGNENFINAKKVLNFIQSLINEKKVIASIKKVPNSIL